MKAKKGSGLIFAVVLLFVILGMVITLSSITVLETKMSQKTKSSIGAFYNSESGVEWALNKIATSTATNITGTFGALKADYTVPTPSGTDYKVYLLDKDGKVITTNLTIDQVKAVRSVGTQGVETQRAIEAAVASGGGQFGGMWGKGQAGSSGYTVGNPLNGDNPGCPAGFTDYMGANFIDGFGGNAYQIHFCYKP